MLFFFFKQKTAYEMRISDWSSDVCSSDLKLNRSQRIFNLMRDAARDVSPGRPALVGKLLRDIVKGQDMPADNLHQLHRQRLRVSPARDLDNGFALPAIEHLRQFRRCIDRKSVV